MFGEPGTRPDLIAKTAPVVPDLEDKPGSVVPQGNPSRGHVARVLRSVLQRLSTGKVHRRLHRGGITRSALDKHADRHRRGARQPLEGISQTAIHEQ